MISNQKVIEQWKKGKKGKSNSMSTDGKKLYSYNLLIGYVGEDGYKYVYNYTAKTDYGCFGHPIKGEFISRTTSKHVGLARRIAYSAPLQRQI